MPPYAICPPQEGVIAKLLVLDDMNQTKGLSRFVGSGQIV